MKDEHGHELVVTQNIWDKISLSQMAFAEKLDSIPVDSPGRQAKVLTAFIKDQDDQIRALMTGVATLESRLNAVAAATGTNEVYYTYLSFEKEHQEEGDSQ